MRNNHSRLSYLSQIIGCSFRGVDVEVETLGLCNRESNSSSILSYVTSHEYVEKALQNPSVKALLVDQNWIEGLKEQSISYILSDTPEADFYRLHALLYEGTNFYKKFDFDSEIGKNCCIHPTVIIERGVRIGNNVEIGAYSVVKSGTVIGNDCHIGCLSIIGSDGFQILRKTNGVPYNVIHAGGTHIGNQVWIGDQVAVSKALFDGNLTIGDNCCVDNQCFISHNCSVGSNNVLTAGVIMLGSAEVKNNCWLAPGSIILNRVVIDDNVFVGANSTVNINPKSETTIMGNPAMEISKFSKIQRVLRDLVRS